MAVNINTVATSWQLGTEGFVLVHGWSNILVLVIIDVTTLANQVLWNWGAEVTSSLLMGLLVGRDHKVVVVHNWVPECEFHGVDQSDDSVELLLRKPVSLEGKERTITHAGSDGMTV